MPEVCRFLGISILMFYRDHQPPHFHAKYSGQVGVFSINDLQMLEGDLPRRVIALVLEWAFDHRVELMENWDRLQNGQEPRKITPLV